MLASRGDTRRLWGEHFLDLEQPRKSAELWAIREALTCFMTAFLAQPPEKEVKALNMSTCGVGSLNPRYAELVRAALEAERTVVNSKWWYRGIEVAVPVLRGIKPNHVIANTLNYFPEYRGEILDGAAVIDSLRLEAILSYRLPKEALKEAGISALVKAQYPSLRLEDKTRATLMFGECVPALNGNKADLDHLIDATQGVLTDSLTPPENGLYYAALDAGLGSLEAAVNAVSRNRFDRLVYKELMAGKDLDPRRLNHEFFSARIEGYDRVQVRVVDSLPIDAYAESEPNITGMGLGLLTASVHDEGGKRKYKTKAGWMDTKSGGRKGVKEKVSQMWASISGEPIARHQLKGLYGEHVFVTAESDESFFNGYFHPRLLAEGVNPHSLAMALNIPEPVNASLRDSPRQVAFAKLAMLAQGEDIYDNPEHGRVIKRRIEACSALADFYHRAVGEVSRRYAQGTEIWELGFSRAANEYKVRALSCVSDGAQAKQDSPRNEAPELALEHGRSR